MKTETKRNVIRKVLRSFKFQPSSIVPSSIVADMEKELNEWDDEFIDEHWEATGGDPEEIAEVIGTEIMVRAKTQTV